MPATWRIPSPRVQNEALVCEIGAKFFGGIALTTEVIDDVTIDVNADPAQPILPLLMSTVTVVPAETPMDSPCRHACGHRSLCLG